jgi:hypothetical protein
MSRPITFKESEFKKAKEIAIRAEAQNKRKEAYEAWRAAAQFAPSQKEYHECRESALDNWNRLQC